MMIMITPTPQNWINTEATTNNSTSALDTNLLDCYPQLCNILP